MSAIVVDVRCPRCGGVIEFRPREDNPNRVQGFCNCNDGPVIELTLDTSAVGQPDEQQGDDIT